MRASAGGITVHAIAGSHAVLFGMDADQGARAGLLGFAIGWRGAGGAITWLRGFKFFAETVPAPRPGERRSTREHPVQDFQWGDYSCQPGQTRTYVIQPLYGTPAALIGGPEIEMTVTTQGTGGDHQVFYNRGAIPSQAFADQFGNIGPDDAEQADPANPKTRWLSRGLLEACLSFIAEATGPGHALHVAAYEFTYPPLARALADAAGRGVSVHLVFDAGDRKRDGTVAPNHTSEANFALIEASGLAQLAALHPRTRYSAITHNKFILRSEGGHPVALWTGSTNFTASGFLGQTNLAHLIRDPALARKFLDYWTLLAADPDTRSLKQALAALTPDPSLPLAENSITPVFSPRPAGMMGVYAQAMAGATSSVMFTAAFGVADELAQVFGQDADHLKLILAERAEGDPARKALLAADPDTRVALGSRLNSRTIALGLEGHRLDQWFRAEEHFRSQGHIFYIHTKLLALDLMGEAPQILTGSANFSTGSVGSNDENMILMRGPAFKAQAAVHATEFMRLFNHLYFRTVAIERAGKPGRPVGPLEPTDAWTTRHFRPGSYHDRMRTLFR